MCVVIVGGFYVLELILILDMVKNYGLFVELKV